jgi:uncharacterized damage-inducible protein DinB
VTTAGLGSAVALLLDYLYWLRDRVLATATELSDNAYRNAPVVGARDLHATLVHELDVEWSWRRRLRDDPDVYDKAAELTPADLPDLPSLAGRWHADEREMREWLAGLEPGELDKPVTRNGLEGHSLAVYLTHVIEHGVTELATAAAILHGIGRSTGDLGVLDALDDLAPLPRPGSPDA